LISSLALALVALTAFVFAPVGGHDFLNLDDAAYVTANPQVAAGLTWRGAAWAVTTGHAGNWHPLTWLSHMLDVEWFGMDAGKHHLTSALLHAGTTVLLFLLLRGLTAAPGRSAFVAALFGVHPLHVESVAWIAERKDVLSTLFWVLTLLAYVVYVRRPSLGRYLTVVITFALGLMAKPMLVTLPFVLLLLDFWPLKRSFAVSGARRVLLYEKLPLLALALASSVATLVVQQQAGAVAALDRLPLDRRVANAIVAYVTYVTRAVWPADLAAIYPYPGALSPWLVAFTAVALVLVSIAAVRAIRVVPYVFVGWFWYLGTLAPVIGLIQVGGQPTADRYTYVPLIGLSIMVAWGAADRVARRPAWRAALGAGALLVVMASAAASRRQVGYWRDSVALWQHAIEATAGNYRAYGNLGHALAERGQWDAAIARYREALTIKPDFAEIHHRLGLALADRGRMTEAIRSYREALRLLPDYVHAHNNLGLALVAEGQIDEAAGHFLDAVRLDPTLAQAHSNLGVARARQGRLDEAVRHFSEALRIAPDSADAHANLAFALTDLGRPREAIPHYREALRLRPADLRARHGLDVALADIEKKD
jgi:tetratricopeptide (TPR) repeat protein